jgi:hypothetical protein
MWKCKSRYEKEFLDNTKLFDRISGLSSSVFGAVGRRSPVVEGGSFLNWLFKLEILGVGSLTHFESRSISIRNCYAGVVGPEF